MTGTMEWKYIKYSKPIVSLKNFSRNKTLNKCNNKHTKPKCHVIKYILLISLFKNITISLIKCNYIKCNLKSSTTAASRIKYIYAD